MTWDTVLISLLPSVLSVAQKGTKSNPTYPEVGDLVYSNDWVKYQSVLDGKFDVVVNKDELIGQIIQMNVTDSKEDYVYYMKISRPNGSIVYVPLLNPYDDAYNQMDNEWYKVVANPNYSYPAQKGGQTTNPTQTPTPKSPTTNPTPSPTKTPSPTPSPKTIPTPTPKSPSTPNYWLIGGISLGGVLLLIIAVAALSNSNENNDAPKSSNTKKR